MRILVLGSEGYDLATIESALRLGEVEILKAGDAPIHTSKAARYAFAEWTLDSATRDLLSASGRRVDLTSSEFDLLMAFVQRPGQTLSRSDLTSVLRGRDWSYFDRSIDTLVARLRKKIDAKMPLIRSVRGVGYVFCASVSLAPAVDRPAVA